MSLSVSSPKTGISLSNLPLACKLLLALSFVEAIGGGISYHIAYYFSVSSSFSKLNIGLLGFFMGIGAIIGSLYGGYFTGKTSPRNLISTSFLIIGFAFIVLAKTTSFYTSLAFVFLMGFGINLFITCSNSSLLQISKNTNVSLSLAQSYKNALENAGGIGAMVLIMFFAQNYFNSAMVVVGLSFVFLALIVFFKLNIKNKEVNIIPTGENKVKTVYSSLIPMLFSVFCIGLTYGIQKTVLGIHLNETIGNSVIIGLFFATDPVLIVLFQVRLAKRIEKYNKHVIASIGCGLLGISTFAMSISTTMLGMFCSLIIFTIGEMLFMAYSVALCHQYGSANHSGLGIGAWRSSYALGMMIGPLISGLAMQFYNAQLAWSISSILCFIGCVLVIKAQLRTSS